ncbi:MAG TPA: homoserine dehydrogenase [Longimicrobiales bacterium]
MKVGVALYGVGVVGGGLAEIVAARRADLLGKHHLTLSFRHMVVRDLARPRPPAVDRSLLTTDLEAPLEDPGVSIVVEAMGGLEPAGTVIRRAIRAGKHVVTANKALIAVHGAELEALAAEHGVLLRYEASVAGAIPVLHALRGALVANRIDRVQGIVNGTTNYILTRMAEDGLDFESALRQAQELGFAEADPSADVSGLDSAHKLVILARHAFGRWSSLDDVTVCGITGVTREQLLDAAREGQALKLVAEARRVDGEIQLRVGPTLVPADSPLARIRNEMNAVLIEGDFAGPLVFMGAGAGAFPTGSAVYADLVEVALSHLNPWMGAVWQERTKARV